jgi:outer membrane protein OmpA-like peptidoglycan-associated protein
MKKIIYTLFSILLISTLHSQNVEFTKSNFPKSGKKLKEAKRFLKIGDELFTGTEFQKPQALGFYLKANAFNPSNAVLNFKLGQCFNISPKRYMSLSYFRKAYELNPNVDPHIAFFLGEAYHLNHEFDEAIKYYTMYKKVPEKRPGFNADKRIAECNTAKQLVANPVRVIIENIGNTVNTEYREYGAVISADESVMLFTSRRPNTTGGGIAPDGLFYEDIYSTTNQNGKWTPPVALPPPVNTKVHDATVALSNDGQKLFIYSPSNEGDILISTLDGDKWSRPVDAGGKSINTKYSEIHACFSYDEKSIYFVSNKPEDSFGGFDIFVTHRDDNGNWSAPKNVGPTINTPYDEEGVYLHPDGKTMYFSSRGHNTMGDYDIFKSTLDTLGNWSTPENIGYPINSADKDVFFVVSASGKHAYYSSAKMDSYGETDIYRITILGDEKQPQFAFEDQPLTSIINPLKEAIAEPRVESRFTSAVTILKGVVRDAQTQEPLNAVIVITDNEKNQIVSTFQSNAKTGRYLVSLPSGRNYGIAVTMEGYLFFSDNVDLPKSKAYQEIEKDVDLSKLEVGRKIVLRNIFYDFDKSTLRTQSIAELNRLVALMNQNPTLKIEISSHTDNVGSAAYNQRLSEARAKSVIDYLTKNGIPMERLEFKGYGFSDPIAPNETDEGRQLNRRTEFKILAR